METGHSSLRAGDLDRLLSEYGVDDSERTLLTAWALQARQRAWWEAYGELLPDAYETFIGFEAEATSILGYEAQIVPGLLQTAEYASAIMRADGLFEDPEVERKLVAVRMARQALLTREPAPRFSVVLDEAVLRRPIGGSDVQRRQLTRLVEAGERETTSIQVLPFSVGGHRSLAGSFYILDFSDESDNSLVYSEGVTGGVLRGRSDDVGAYRQRFLALQAAALTPEDSVAFIVDATRGGM